MDTTELLRLVGQGGAEDLGEFFSGHRERPRSIYRCAWIAA
jgi:hypothetical protein